MRICAVGDSFVNGTNDPACQGWIGRVVTQHMGRIPDLTLYNLGIRGDTSSDIRRRWVSEVRLRLPAQYEGRLVFSFGVNDCGIDDQTGERTVSAETTLANATVILREASGAWPTLMVGPPPVDDAERNTAILALDTGLQQVSHEVGVPYLSVFARLRALDTWMHEVKTGDGAHPAAAGYAAFARLVAEWDAWQAWFA